MFNGNEYKNIQQKIKDSCIKLIYQKSIVKDYFIYKKKLFLNID